MFKRNRRYFSHPIGLVLAIAVLVAGCGSPAPTPAPGVQNPGPVATSIPLDAKPAYTPGPNEAQIYFFEPMDGDRVTSPVLVRFGVGNYMVNNGRVNAYVAVDRNCTAPGQAIPLDANHVRFERDRQDLELELPTGQHRLCLQGADNNGLALDGPGLRQVIDIIVE